MRPTWPRQCSDESDTGCCIGESVNTGLDWTGLEYWNDL